MTSADIPIRAPDSALTIITAQASHLLGNRAVLGCLIDARAVLDEKIKTLGQAQDRVQGVIAEAEEAEHETAWALDEESRRIRAWATSGGGSLRASDTAATAGTGSMPDGDPLPDGTLVARREAMWSQAAAAQTATASLVAELNDTARCRAAIDLQIEALAAQIVADEAGPVLAALREAVGRAAALASEAEGIGAIVVEAAHERFTGPDGEEHRRMLLQAAERIQVELRAAMNVSSDPDRQAAARGRWRALAERLTDDAGAALDAA